MAKRSRKIKSAEKDPDEVLLQEIRDNFKRCQDWEESFRRLYIADVKFANGDSDNGWQWPDDLRRDREANKRPALTINKVQRHVALITNDARQNKPSISFKPTGEEASFKSAQVFEGVVREIEYRSRAQDIYDDATDSQVEGGIGYWRVTHNYVDEKTFDQQISITAVANHLGVYLDPDIKQKSGLDAKFGFIFDEMPRKEFEKEYPDFDANTIGSGLTIDESDDWVREDYIRIAEYYRLKRKKDRLFWVRDKATGEETTFLASQAPKGFEDDLVPGEYRERETTTVQLEWFKIVGSKIVDRIDEDNEFPLKGKYIPIIRCVGIEKKIEGRLERKGLVRTLKDPQRMYNYNTSGEVEFGALQTKTPWTGSAAAFEGQEVQWNNANTSNAAYLTYNHLDSEGNPLPESAIPRRNDPPNVVPAFIQGMAIAAQEMEMVSGQYAAQMGAPSNEKSGKAIAERQRQADIANYLFVNNLAVAIRATGVVILDLFPHIYDTKRVLQILGKDGTEMTVEVDPDAAQAYQELEGEVNRIIFNPNVGKYEVQADVGPAYSTQRQEAWNAFTQIVSSAPDLIAKIGDLMFRSADFPMADKIADRLRRDIETNAPYLIKDGAPPPMVTQLQDQLKQSQGQVAELIQKLAEKNLDLKDRDERNATYQYEAESKRLTAETNSIVDLKKSNIVLHELLTTIQNTLSEMNNRQNDFQDLSAPPEGNEQAINENEPSETAPVPGAVKHKDGNWYVQRGDQFFAVLPGISQEDGSNAMQVPLDHNPFEEKENATQER